MQHHLRLITPIITRTSVDLTFHIQIGLVWRCGLAIGVSQMLFTKKIFEYFMVYSLHASPWERTNVTGRIMCEKHAMVVNSFGGKST